MTIKRIVDWLLALTFVAGVGAADVASAQQQPTVPEECTASRDQRGWTSGRSAGESRVNSLWRSAAVGQDLDKLSDALPGALETLETALSGLAANAEPTQYVRCRAQGYAEGYFFRLNQLFGQCVVDGADWGQLAANIYCSLSIELDGLAESSLFVRAPVGLCGNLFEYTCEDVYRYVGKEGDHEFQPLVANFLESNGFVVEPFAGCGPYTDDEFLAAFESSLHNDCTYEQE